jgi:hypothetical protein
MLDAIVKHLSMAELEAGLDEIRRSPKDQGVLELLVCRPAENQREVLETGELDLELGLLGDNWKTRGSSRTNDGFGHPEMQLNIMNSRAIALLAQNKDRWQLAGDQLFIDMELSDENLPPGSRLKIGEAIIEVTAIPHNGCKKFTERFGLDAVKFVNSAIGKELHLRGINAKVIKPGKISVGDVVEKI